MNRFSSLKFRETHPRLTGHIFPASAPTELVIPCRSQFYGYCQVFEAPADTRLDHSLDQINQSIRKINTAVDLILIQKKQEFDKDYQGNNILAIKMLGGLSLATGLVLYFSVLYDLPHFREFYLFFAMAIILASTILSLMILVKGLMMRRVPPNYEKLIVKAIDKVIARENAGVFSARGWLLEKYDPGKCLKLKRVGLPHPG
jgi:hypothetical protein